jgi:hypothetical protein
MAQADRATGKEIFLSWTPTAGTEIILDTDYRSFTKNRTMNEVDLTAGDDDFEYMGDSFTRGEITVTVLAGDDDVDDITEGQTGSLIYGRRGNGSTMRKETIPAKVLSIEEASEYAGAQSLDITFRQTATATIGTFT